MISTSKSISVLIILILAVSILTFVESASAQTIPKPSVPEFSLKYVDGSYDVPSSYSTNPYTGENITHSGYHVDNRTIQITIVNSNFASSFGNLYFMYYNVQIKGHNVENWTNLFPYVPNSPSGLLPQSDAQYTIISESVQSLPSNVPLDFRVQSLLIKQTIDFEVIGTSEWSSAQTITIPINSPSPTPTAPNNSTSSNQQLTNTALIVAVAVLAIAVISLLVYVRKIKSRVKAG